MDIVCRTRSSMAELPALNRVAAGSSPAGCIAHSAWKDKGASEDDMERLISLFREPQPDDGYVSPGEVSRPPPPPQQAALKVISDEPIYFQQLLEYLRREKQKRSDHEDDEGGGAD